MTSEQALIEKQATETVERVKEMCRRAFNEGVRQGYGNGFQAGVAAAMGDVPKPNIKLTD